MDKLYRLLGTAVAIGNATAFILGIDMADLGTVGKILSDPAVRWGIVTASVIVALGLSWPAIQWAWTYPVRRRVARETATQERESAAQEEENRSRSEVIRLLTIIRTPDDIMIGISNPNELAEVIAASQVAQAKIKAMGLAISSQEIEKMGGWGTYAACLTPYIKEFGIEEARRMVSRGSIPPA